MPVSTMRHLLTRGGRRYLRLGGTDDAACVRGIWGHAPPEKFLRLDALRSLLRSYLYPNATSPTRVHGRINTAIHHDTRQSSWGVSVAVVDFVHVGPDRWASYRWLDDLDKNNSYFVLHFETSSVITQCKSGHHEIWSLPILTVRF